MHRCLLAAFVLLPLLPGHAFAQSSAKSKSTTKTNTKAATGKFTPAPAPKMVCEFGYYKCSDAYGNCCKVGWTCTSDGMCAPPPGLAASDGAAPKAQKPGLKFNNEGTFQVSGAGAGGSGGGGGLAKSKAYVAKNENVAQWPGFRMNADGGSEVMVEFSKTTATPTEHRAAGSVTYVFKGAHVIKHNNQNPLITVHFNTPVVSARLIPKGSELHLRIEYRAGADVAAASGMRPGIDGSGQQFFVKFPSGSWLPNGAENDTEIVPTQKLKAKAAPSTTPAPPKTESGGKIGPSP